MNRFRWSVHGVLPGDAASVATVLEKALNDLEDGDYQIDRVIGDHNTGLTVIGKKPRHPRTPVNRLPEE